MKRRGSARGDVMLRCIKLIDMINSGKEFTLKDVQEKLDVAKCSARLYVQAASLHYPITQTDKRPLRFSLMQ